MWSGRNGGARVLLQAALGAVLVIGATGAGVAAATYFWVSKLPDVPGPVPTPIPNAPTERPQPGGPRTLLILGSDRRSAHSADGAIDFRPRSDTILLVRLDPKRKRIATLSIPRDLAVSIPGHGDGMKINQAYDIGQAALAARAVKRLFHDATGGNFPINSIVDVDFNGFQRVVNYLHGVYVDVDHDYYVAPDSGTSAIDVKAGYQRLVGSDALAYVRYRHTDSDLYRAARQQDFLRQAAHQPAVRDVENVGDARRLLGILRRYMRVDKDFFSARNLFGLLKTSVYLAAGGAQVSQIPFSGVTESASPQTDTRLFISRASLQRIHAAFMDGDAPKPSGGRRPAAPPATGGLEKAGAPAKAAKLRFPFYFPAVLANGSTYPSGTPRAYTLRDALGKGHEAYRLSISTGAAGEYYGVQGTTWTAPPILDNPTRVVSRNGRRLMLFYDGSRLRVVGWRTRKAAYWVSNTVTHSIANARLLAIAATLTT